MNIALIAGMKKFAFVSCAVLLFVVAIPADAQHASSDMQIGVRIGITDSDPMVGGEVLIPLRAHFVANPTVELTKNLLTANADFHYDFRIDSRSSWWLGAGGALIKARHGDSGFGVNVLGGYGRRWNDVYPYAQVRVTSTSVVSDFASVAVGLRF